MNKVNNIIIFVGGRGTRLGDITKTTPKPLITFNNIEFIYYQINLLSKKLHQNKLFFYVDTKNKYLKKNFTIKLIMVLKLNVYLKKNYLVQEVVLKMQKNIL